MCKNNSFCFAEWFLLCEPPRLWGLGILLPVLIWRLDLHVAFSAFASILFSPPSLVTDWLHPLLISLLCWEEYSFVILLSLCHFYRLCSPCGLELSTEDVFSEILWSLRCFLTSCRFILVFFCSRPSVSSAYRWKTAANRYKVSAKTPNIIAKMNMQLHSNTSHFLHVVPLVLSSNEG